MSIYVFGYGSLINMSENVELENYMQCEIIPVKIMGLQRKWNIHGENQTYLGIIENDDFWCNGIIFRVSDKDLNYLDLREKYYEKRFIKKEKIKFYEDYDKNIVFIENDQIIYYHADPKYLGSPSTKYPIKEEYLNICLIGCEKISKLFKMDFIISTHF